MSFNWERIAVVGACGKMGSGISLLLLQEMARHACENHGRVKGAPFRLYLIDQDEEALFNLRDHFRPQIRRYAEKKINFLREAFLERKELVSNEEMIDEFVNGAIDNLRFSKDLDKAASAEWIFEAIVEDEEIKSRLYQSLKSICSKDALFFTNTSSIPISTLQEKGNLPGRIIGFHFYNPPQVQKLVEVITTANTDPALLDAAEEIGRRLKKVMVKAHDVAGFIGNGHFIREIDFACRLVEELTPDIGREKAICRVDAMTRDELLRPMGIFQLIDYVGIDICLSIAKVMSEHIADKEFRFDLLEEMLENGVRGGQNPDGTQKDGFFRYQKGKIIAVYSLENQQYVSIEPVKRKELSWKGLLKDPDQKEKVEQHEKVLFEQPGEEIELAKKFLIHSRDVVDSLVKEGVANSKEDVHTVLRNGFYHIFL